MDTFLIVAETDQGYLWLLSDGHVTIGSRSRYGKHVAAIEGPDEGFSHEFSSVARLGRAQGLELCLQDPELSEHHATLEVWDGRVFLADTNVCIELANEQCFKAGSNTFRVSWKQI